MKENITSNAFEHGVDNEEMKRERMKYYSEVYWSRMSKIISEKTFNVWKALDKGLTNYHDLLFERKKLADEVKGMYEKNKELKKLLTQYMESDDNKALHIPPYQTLKRVDLNFALSDI